MPTAPKHSWFKTGLRFCGSCAVTVSCWALWIALGLLLAALIYIALAKELPVPGYVLRRIEGELARSGLSLSFGRARFDPTGKVLLQDVRLRSAGFEDPLLTCRLLYVRHDFWSLLAGWTFPAEIQAEGAALQLPAMLAPSGTAEPVVRDLAVTLRRQGPVWHVEQAAGRLGPLALTLQGEFIPPRGTAAAPDLEVITARFLQTARRLAPLLSRLDTLDRPALAVRLDSDAGGVNRAHLLLTAAGANRPWGQPVITGPFVAGTSVRLGGREPQTVEIQFAVRQAEGPDGVRAHALRAVLHAAIPPETFAPRPGELHVAAAFVETPEGTVRGPVLRTDLARWPLVHAETALQLEGEILAAQVEASLTEKSARLRATGRGHPDFINRALDRHTPRAAPFFRFGDPVAFDAEAVLDPGWRFARLAARAEAGRIDSRGVAIDSARGRITIEGQSFLAHDARVTLGESAARGSYWMDFGTTDYRMLLAGRLHPAAISGWFRGDWWPQFWNRWFAFPAGHPPAAEVDVQGRWKQPWLSRNFVRARATQAAVWGGDFETVDATVFVRPAFAHGLALAAARAGGTQHLTGSFKRFARPDLRGTDRFEFDFDTDADPAVLGRMLEGRADEVLASLRFTAPPQIHAWGALDADGAGLVPDYRFAARAAAPLHYYGFPLEHARVQGGVTGGDVRLEEIEFGAAGGRGAGKGTLTGGPGRRLLGFDLYLNRARLGATVHAVQEYDAARTGTPLPTGPDSKFVRTAANSLLDVSLSAQGDPASLASFKGSGQAALTGGELGEVHLFGLLSQVLSGLSLSFSSLKFDAAHTGFELDRGELYFPDLKVTGPSAAIDARGRYAFATNALDFTARFKPYDQPGSLLAAAVSLVMNPLTSILELKLNGPLADPKWSVLVSPGPRPSMAPEPAPPAADPADSAPKTAPAGG